MHAKDGDLGLFKTDPVIMDLNLKLNPFGWSFKVRNWAQTQRPWTLEISSSEPEIRSFTIMDSTHALFDASFLS